MLIMPTAAYAAVVYAGASLREPALCILHSMLSLQPYGSSSLLTVYFLLSLQAMAAAFTEVSISPPELLLRTDVASQALQLTLTNTGPSAITYAVSHSPAVAVSISKAWYRQTYDEQAPFAAVVAQPAEVTVPGKGKATVTVRRCLGWLQAYPAIR
jgi:hypothetical protein